MGYLNDLLSRNPPVIDGDTIRPHHKYTDDLYMGGEVLRMAEYIEREKAFKLIKEQKEKETGAYSKGRNKGLIIAGSIINNKEVLPTADVEEVKHGYWVEYEDDFWIMCSECGVEQWDDCNERQTAFCPYCGAKMDGGKVE